MIFILIWLILFVALIQGIIFQFLMVRYRKPKVKLFDSKILFNPFNVQFFGQKYLTEKGIHLRNKSWLYISVFTVTILIFLCLKTLIFR